MSSLAMTEEQRDVLQEIANIGMGQAGKALAQLFKIYIDLSIPRISLVDTAQILGMLSPILAPDLLVTVVRQAFYEDLRGEAAVVFVGDPTNQISELVGYSPDDGDSDELLLEVTNILVGACLGMIASQLSATTRYNPPAMMGKLIPLRQVLSADHMTWTHALLMEVSFRVRESSFSAHLMGFLPEDSAERVLKGLDQILDGMQ